MLNKKALIFFLSLLVIVITYCGAWYAYAAYFEKQLKTVLISALESDNSSISYDKTTIEGFPINIAIRIHNPKVHIQTSKLIEKFAAEEKNSSKPQENKTTPEMTAPNANPQTAMLGMLLKDKLPGFQGDKEKLQNPNKTKEENFEHDISIDGDILVKTDLQSKNYTITQVGASHIIESENGKNLKFTTKSTDNNAVVKFSKSPLFIKPSANGDVLENILIYISSFEFVMHGSEVKNEDTGEVLFSNGDMSLTIIPQNMDKPSRTIKLQANSQFDSPQEPEFGRNNLDIDLSYSGPTQPEEFSKPDFTFRFDINKFNGSNDLVADKVNGVFYLAKKNDAVTNLKTAFNLEMKFDKKWYDFAKSTIIKNKQKLLSDPTLTLEDTKKLNIVITNIDKILPNLHDFGDIKITKQIDYDGAGDGKLKGYFVLSSDLYGLKIGASGGGNPKSLPDAKVVVSLMNYDDAINDGFKYYKKLAPLMQEASGKPASFEIQDDFKEALVSTLQKLSDTPDTDSKNKSITILLDKQHPLPAIGKMSFPEAMVLVQTSLTPHIKQILTPEEEAAKAALAAAMAAQSAGKDATTISQKPEISPAVGNPAIILNKIADVPNGRVLWLDASDSSTITADKNCQAGAKIADNSSIGCWKDKSGHSYNAAQENIANKPVYTANGINNKPAIRFNGRGSYMNIPNTSLLNSMSAGIASGSTVFLAAKTTRIQNSSVLELHPYTQGGVYFNIHLPMGDTLFWDNGVCCGTGRLTAKWGGTEGVPYVWSMDSIGTTQQDIWRNGQLIATHASAQLANYGSSYSMDIGVFGDTNIGRSSFFNGDISEIMIYNRGLPAPERKNIEARLGAKWGVVVQ